MIRDVYFARIYKKTYNNVKENKKTLLCVLVFFLISLF